MSNSNEQDDDELKKIRQKKLEQLQQRIHDPQPKSTRGVVKLNSGNFFETITNANLSIVDLWADWCAPCLMMGPIFEKLATSKEYEKVIFCSLNADENPQILQHFGVTGIPTFLVFSRGKLVNKIIGAVGEGGLRNSLNAIMAKFG